MIIFRKCWFVLLLLGVGSISWCQAVVDNSVYLPLDTVMAWTLREHPIARLADAIESRGVALIQNAQGAFDPLIVASHDRKEFQGSEYFNYSDVGFEWQSPLALKLATGRQWAEGVYLNNDQTVPDRGQAYITLKLPLLQGLLIDKYRTQVRQSTFDQEQNRAAAEVVRNELRFDVAILYTNWLFAKLSYDVSVETESLIRVRLENTQGLYEQGDKPAVDTLEARISLANQELTTQELGVQLMLAEQELKALYWPLSEVDLPIIFEAELPELLNTQIENPILTELRAQQSSLLLERRLKAEYLKPQLDVSYSLLGDGFDFAPTSPSNPEAPLLTRAYKFGATFSYPILNRSARAQVTLADLKLLENRSKLNGKAQELQQKERAYAEATARYTSQLASVQQLVEQSEQLLIAERELFGLGESTQFLLNSREQSLQKARLTELKLQASRAKAIWNWRAASAIWE